MSDQTVDVSAGAVEYTFPRTITETTGKDISADQIAVSLGSYDAPGAWVPPDRLTHPTPSSAVVQLLVSNSLGLIVGQSYYLWTKVTESPEVIPRRSPGRVTIA